MNYIKYCTYLVEYLKLHYKFDSIRLQQFYEFDKIDMVLHKDSYGIFVGDDILKRAYYLHMNIGKKFNSNTETDTDFIKGIIEKQWLDFIRKQEVNK